jgi:hypothetical protein
VVSGPLATLEDELNAARQRLDKFKADYRRLYGDKKVLALPLIGPPSKQDTYKLGFR